MNGATSQPIGMNGLASVVNAAAGESRTAVFTADSSATRTISNIDPTTANKVFVSVAGPSALTLQATMDSAAAVKAGNAVWAAVKTYANVTADGYMGTLDKGVSALRVTHVKVGAGIDTAGKVTSLGGRAQVRVVPTSDMDATTGLGDYTAMTAT